MSLRELVEISNEVGIDPDFVLAGGGNTSFKTADALYIKGSGTTLAAITEAGFVRMNRKALAVIREKRYPEEPKVREAAVLADLMDAREKTETAKRPSVETSLHDLFPMAFVVHTHPARINGLTCSTAGRETARELYGDRVLWIDETPPGYVLAKAVENAMTEYHRNTGRHADMMLIQNHGLFVAADSVAGIREKTAWIMDRLKARIMREPDFTPADTDRDRAARIAPALRMMLMPEDGGPSLLTFISTVETARLTANRTAFTPVSSAFTPDHIVYCRHEALFVSRAEDMEAQYALLKEGIDGYRTRYGFAPKIIAVEGLGIYAWGRSWKEADIAAQLFMDAVRVSVYAESFGAIRFMADDMIRFILAWEVESYRASVALDTARRKRLDGKIVIVTGSAQGFGQGIAEAMMEEGACMVIADLNGELAEANAQALCAVYGKDAAMAVRVDVSSETDVDVMVRETVLRYGGLDVYVSNAGILKAGGLEEMSLSAFELITKINYTAYFLGARAASRPMKIQHRFRDLYFMDIIQVNSKSGLSGSNRNFAYAGGKFGGIGLTQSFALELVGDGIKVNSVCPGNFFDGPLWADPEKGLFVQYLRTGKVPGARTVEDVKRFYEEKVPMGRGCEVRDVARAIFYVIEQEYETGQAVPVTGGQNMLK